MADNTFKLGTAGFVPPKFVWSFRDFNFENKDNANGHNEASVTATCGGIHLFRDSFDVAGTVLGGGKGYLLEISVDSWTRPPLWRQGLIRLEYDAVADRWTMNGAVDDRAWGFCNAKAVVDLVVAGLRCVAGDSKIPTAASAEVFARSIEADAQRIVEGVKRYTGDCSYVDPADRVEFSN